MKLEEKYKVIVDGKVLIVIGTGSKELSELGNIRLGYQRFYGNYTNSWRRSSGVVKNNIFY